MKLTLVVVGKVRGELAPAVAEYERRAARYWRLAVEEVSAGSPGARDDAEAVMAAEAERILGRIPEGAAVALLTRAGRALPSRQLARWLRDQAAARSAGVALVIGGAYGVHSSVSEGAAMHVCLSALTLPHELARLVLAEQLYRAGTILRGEPYHKGP
ncbi:MAG: 23S rRNA (pseudouridine(1915)-N(3))-methyltransferase RlmH [Longimicrobiales bacterium]|nr:23S rRNA (pseudouridine(1915)-N(3))-methyltransferase RlmH [Longimicrobiales bacterium]